MTSDCSGQYVGSYLALDEAINEEKSIVITTDVSSGWQDEICIRCSGHEDEEAEFQEDYEAITFHQYPECDESDLDKPLISPKILSYPCPEGMQCVIHEGQTYSFDEFRS